MKKIFLFTILGMMLVACKKSKTSSQVNPDTLPVNTIVATINGAVRTFNINVFDTAETQTGSFTEYTRLVRAYENGNGDSTFLGLDIESHSMITTKTYTDTSIISQDNLQAFLANAQTGFENGRIKSSPFTINVTSITPTSIQGTFNGPLYFRDENDNLTQTKVMVTNGLFNINK
jgi:hypothetical protein